jgi:MinD superfamily P-loop ATPase
MIITIASGKGGTGKTTIATSLALSLAAELNTPPLFLDCDVEAPNAHLFLQPLFTNQQPVGIMIPEIDLQRCNYCGKCAEVCQYHAIVVLGKKTLVFPQLCHGCGSCSALCPEQAIIEVSNSIGILEAGKAKAGLSFARGVLNVGEPMSVPIIRQLKKWATPLPDQVVIRDAPPGTSCPVVEAVRGSDYLILVTEPTPFGLHDLRLAAQMAEELGLQVGVIVNRTNDPFPALETFFAKRNLPVLLRIPFERAIAEGIAQGKSLIDMRPDYRQQFFRMFMKIISSSRKMVVLNSSARSLVNYQPGKREIIKQ